MLNVGIVGCGAIGLRHIEALRADPRVKICGVCDVAPQNAVKAANLVGAIPYYDYHQMAVSTPLDAVLICLPHALHAPCVTFFAAQKVPIFLEKPMDVSISSCQSIIQSCTDAGVMLMVGHVQRYFPENIAAKALIDSGKYGTLIGMSETRNMHYFSDTRPKWFLDQNLSGGGILMNLGAHTLDKLKYFSESTIKSAVGHAHISSEHSVDGSVQALIRMQNGITATINLMGFTHADTYETILYLTHGEIRIFPGKSVTVASCDGVFHDVDIPGEDPFKAQMNEMISAITERRAPLVDGAYGLDVIRGIEMIYGHSN